MTAVLKLDRVHFDKSNHRTPSKEKIATLAASIKADGQLQPIMVCQAKDFGVRGAIPDDDYIVVFGHRRVLARRLNGDAEIDAVIEKITDREHLMRLRTVENLDQEGLTPADEALAVAQYLDVVEGETPSEKIAEAASRLGRSETWVRDRAFVARLGGAARDLLAAGLLPFGHAREIAKLADPELRDHLAQTVATNEDGSGGMMFEQVKAYVEQHMRSLRLVPWQLDKPVGDKPACTTCPHNSVNDRGLFEHDDEQPAETGVCLNEPCFEAKTKACEKACNDAAKKAAGGKEVDTKAHEYVKPTTLKRSVDKATGKVPAAKASGGDAGLKRDAEESWEAKYKRQDKARRLREADEDKWFDEIEAQAPHASVFCAILDGSRSVGGDKYLKAFAKFARQVSGDPHILSYFVEFAKTLPLKPLREESYYNHEDLQALEVVFEAAGVKLPKLPKTQAEYEKELEQLAPKAAPKPAPAKKHSAKQPKPAKKKAGKGGKKKVRR